MYNLSFICRESKSDRNGLSAVELSIVIDGKRTYVALPMKVSARDFKKKMESKRNNDILEYTSSVRVKLNKYINEMMLHNIPITAQSIKDYFLNGGIKTYMLQDVINEFLEYQEKKTSIEALRKYRLALDKLLAFVGNVELKHIKAIHLEELKIDLKNRGFEDSTLNHILARIKTMFTYAHNKNYIEINEMAFMKINKKPKEVEYLTEEEIERIAKKDFGNERLNKVRDLFLFQCETATAFADMIQITFLDIQCEDGVNFVKKKRQKTGIEFFTVLSPTALNILKRYNFNLNIISNQKCNAYLKEIADVCRIDKPLHTHIARHTAATRLLNNGYRLEIVSKILGHTNTKQTMHYAKLMDKTVLKEFKRLAI